MPTRLRISSVLPVPGKLALIIRWGSGESHTVDLSSYVDQFPALAPLNELSRFSQVSVGEWGFDVTWGNNLELAAAVLHRLALEQTENLILGSAGNGGPSTV